MEEQIDKAIEMLVSELGRPGGRPKPEDALKLSQAALNLAHAKVLLEGKRKPTS